MHFYSTYKQIGLNKYLNVVYCNDILKINEWTNRDMIYRNLYLKKIK